MAGSHEPASRLYAIADAECLGSEPARFADCVVAMVRGGVRLLQLRLKPRAPNLAGDDVLRCEIVEETLKALDAEGLRTEVQLWLDDRADLAILFPGVFAGVHVGQTDLPPSAVRTVLGHPNPERRAAGALVGLSCHDADQVRTADADDDVDWVAIGPVHRTGSKPDPDPVVGLEGVRQARVATGKPLVAIGGLDGERIPAALEAGADAAVVLGALVAGGSEPRDVEANARRLVEIAASTRIHPPTPETQGSAMSREQESEETR